MLHTLADVTGDLARLGFNLLLLGLGAWLLYYIVKSAR